MQCPVHHEIELLTITVEGIKIQQCSKCYGHWLDHGELAQLAARDTSVEPTPSITRSSSRMCPIDATPLSEVEFPEHSGLRVDVCPECQGIWLDANELSQALTLLGRPATPATSNNLSRSVLDFLARITGGRTR
jgi:Zn-finger nucleic acid-binding protein